MDKELINQEVNKQIDQWIELQQKRNINVIFTSRSIELLKEIIENIELDKSMYWNPEYKDSKTNQEFAISLIKNALNDIVPISRRRYNNHKMEIYTISSWEILHSISRILDRFCFIPKKRV